MLSARPWLRVEGRVRARDEPGRQPPCSFEFLWRAPFEPVRQTAARLARIAVRANQHEAGPTVERTVRFASADVVQQGLSFDQFCFF